MELMLTLNQRNAQLPFGRLVKECAEKPNAQIVIYLLVLAAIEQVLNGAKLKRVEARGSTPKELITVGDYVFVITPAATSAGDVELCKAMIRLGKRVVWLVQNGCEESALRGLRRNRISRRVEVREIDSYLALRTLFTSLDNGISTESAALRILTRCNELLTARNLRMKISVT
ncbi:MAG TPA: hypothetical protein VIM11_28050 [Tepidisphaeraceae bacterium]|jgi:hypothetical protein